MAKSRGEGKEAGCSASEEIGFNGCYPKCEDGYTGMGIFCASNCPADFKSYAYYC